VTIQYAGNGGNFATASGNLAVTIPATATAGDTIIIAAQWNSNAIPSLPAGWTKFLDQTAGAISRGFAAWKTRQAGDPSSVTITRAGTASMIGTTMVFRNVDQTNPINGATAKAITATATSWSSNALAPSASASGGMAVYIACVNDNFANSGYAGGIGLTWFEQFDYATNLGNDTAIAMATGYPKNDTTSVTVTHTVATGDIGETLFFYLKPATTATFDNTATYAVGLSAVFVPQQTIHEAITWRLGNALSATGALDISNTLTYSAGVALSESVEAILNPTATYGLAAGVAFAGGFIYDNQLTFMCLPGFELASGLAFDAGALFGLHLMVDAAGFAGTTYNDTLTIGIDLALTAIGQGGYGITPAVSSTWGAVGPAGLIWTPTSGQSATWNNQTIQVSPWTPITPNTSEWST
jgi:hypothetical protein